MRTLLVAFVVACSSSTSAPVISNLGYTPKTATAGTDTALIGEARRLGYVKPGERLFIVKGLDAWRRAQRTIGRHGR